MCIENTLGSYKPHFWAGERWEHVRDFAGSGLRTALDRFADALFWEGLAYMAYMAYQTFWHQVAPDLDTLREPFARHAAVPTGWICDFASFAAFLRGWGEVVEEADRRGWGMVGLRCWEMAATARARQDSASCAGRRRRPS